MTALRVTTATWHSSKANPNVAISAIGGSITCSRTSGQTPCFIQVSASAITGTGTSRPYEDLSYSWDFGDPTGTETFTNPGVGGGTKNANSQQTGPEAAYCYRTAGTYTVTLTVVGKNGTGGIATTFTQSITVSSFSASGGEWWFDQVNGSDANDGLSIGAPKQSISALNTILAGKSNVRFNLKRGSDWTGSRGIGSASNAMHNTTASGIRFAAYGSGAKPRVIINDASLFYAAFGLDTGGSIPSANNKSDIVCSSIVFGQTNTAIGNVVVLTNGRYSDSGTTLSNIYFDNCDFVSDTTMLSGDCNLLIWPVLGCSKFGVWGGSFASSLVAVANTARQIGIAGSAADWHFSVGFSIEGAGGSVSGSTLDHHIYPDHLSHGLYRWINFGSGPSRNYCLNTNWNQTTGGLEYPQYLLFADCNFSGTNAAFDLGESSKLTLTFTNGSANITVSTWNTSNGPAPSVDQAVYLSADGGALPTNFVEGTIYYIKSIAGTTFTLAAATPTAGEAAILAGSAQTGSPVLYRTLYKNIVTQSSKYHSLAGGPSFFQAQTLTMRDCEVYGITGGLFLVPQPNLKNLFSSRIYRNKIHIASTQSGSLGSLVFYLPTNTQIQHITDNIIQDDRTVAQILALPWATQPSVGSIVDRNQYWAPNDSDAKFLYDGSTAKTFGPGAGTWQAQLLDVNSTYANPNWSNPAAGSF